jgi:hypothetical protein
MKFVLVLLAIASVSSQPTLTAIVCPNVGASVEILDFEGLRLDNTIAGFLCTLVEVSSTDDIKPIARSYDGNDWEPYAGDFAYATFACYSGACNVDSVTQKTGGYRYFLTSSTHVLSNDALKKARFLEKTTFGPTKADISAFNGDAANWVKDQVNSAVTPLTSHRAFWRSRVTAWHTEPQRSGTLFTSPCDSGARYRGYAFINKDLNRYLHVSRTDSGKFALAVSTKKDEPGLLRTVVGNVTYRGDRIENTWDYYYPEVADGQ